MALVTYTDAIRHLRLEGSDPDQQDINSKMEQATALVINYLKRPDHGWTVETDPSEDYEFAMVQAAIFKVIRNLDAYRGEDARDPMEGVIQMLSMLRDPALA